jgi:hypothetical protein
MVEKDLEDLPIWVGSLGREVIFSFNLQKLNTRTTNNAINKCTNEQTVIKRSTNG